MPFYSQFNRSLRVKTPLGEDQLLPVRFSGTEALSQLFRFELELLAPLDAEIAFDKILGQSVTVELQDPVGFPRYFNGIVRTFEEGMADNEFLHFKAEIVPQLWLATQRFRSRIFQQKSVPEILATVFEGMQTSVELSGTYSPRNYCVQYQETDFEFASRLMEEEGIFYYFRHEQDSHCLVVTDGPYQLKDLQDCPTLYFDPLEGGMRDGPCVYAWHKRQEICASQVTLWDHTFELPGKNLEAQAAVQQTVQVGQVSHSLPGTEETLEVYEFPGRYAQRYDGIDPGGAPRPDDLQNLYTDNTQTAKVAIEAKAAAALHIGGQTNTATLCPGYTFTLERHINANGKYLLVEVTHRAELPSNYRSDRNATGFRYENEFACLPEGLSFRPQRTTPRPRVMGLQTATVVGPQGDQLFLDRYGRIKVQFHWDREGQNDGNSSCWLRVSQAWAGQGWGAFFWPRVGHEVLVGFLEGDPDRPIVVGSVYNAQNMPPMEMPQQATACGFKSCTVGGDPATQFNCLVFYDKPGDEHVHIHSETHECITSESSNFRRTYGPHIEVVGVLPLGAGGGGGALDPDGNDMLLPPAFDLLKPAGLTVPPHGRCERQTTGGPPFTPPEHSGGGGGILDWAVAPSEFAKGSAFNDIWKTLLPGSQKYQLGSQVNATVFGDRSAHIMFGADNRVCIDPEALLWGMLPGFKGGVAAAILSGLGGANSMVVGPAASLQYYHALNVRRGKQFNFDAPSFAKNPTNPKYLTAPVVVMAGLTMATALVGDLMVAIKARVDNTDNSEDYPTWATFLATFVSSKCQALLEEMEKLNAEIMHAEKHATQAANVGQQAAGLALQQSCGVDTFSILVNYAQRTVLSGMDAVLPPDVAPDQVLAENNLIAEGNYTRRAVGDICLNSEGHEGAATVTSISAMGGGETAYNGLVSLYGSKGVQMQAGVAEPTFVKVETSASAGKLCVVNGNLGASSFVHIRQGMPGLGPQITLAQTPPSLQISVGDAPAAGSVINMTTTSLELSIGQAKISMSPDSITLSVGTSKLELAAAGVTIGGNDITVGSGSTMSATYQATSLALKGSGTANLSGGMINIGS